MHQQRHCAGARFELAATKPAHDPSDGSSQDYLATAPDRSCRGLQRGGHLRAYAPQNLAHGGLGVRDLGRRRNGKLFVDPVRRNGRDRRADFRRACLPWTIVSIASPIEGGNDKRGADDAAFRHYSSDTKLRWRSGTGNQHRDGR